MELDYEHIDPLFCPKQFLGEVKADQRGFPFIDFKDYYGTLGYVKLSSLALCQQPGASAIWIGSVADGAKVMAKDAARLGVETTETTGWVDYPLPPEVVISNDLHLSRDQVASLIPVLQRWVETGELSV